MQSFCPCILVTVLFINVYKVTSFRGWSDFDTSSSDVTSVKRGTFSPITAELHSNQMLPKVVLIHFVFLVFERSLNVELCWFSCFQMNLISAEHKRKKKALFEAVELQRHQVDRGAKAPEISDSKGSHFYKILQVFNQGGNFFYQTSLHE